MYTPSLGTRVEALGAQFFFDRDDEALLELLGTLHRAGVETVAAGMEVASLPVESVKAMGVYFVAHCKRWSGVTPPVSDEEEAPEQGKQWTCSEENRAALPLLDRLAVMIPYLDKAGDDLAGKLSGLPMSATPPKSDEEAYGDCGTATKQPEPTVSASTDPEE